MGQPRKYGYVVEHYNDEPIPFDTTFGPEDGEWMAEDAAEHYHSEHDGWEASWPVQFRLVHLDAGVEIGTFEVDRETVPKFRASKVPAPPISERSEGE